MQTNLSLNGTWDFVADLDPKYHAQQLSYALRETNRRHWLKAPVPGVWQKYGDRYDLFEGVGWFAREFEMQTFTDSTKVLIRFGGVNYLCRIFLNGKEVGGHEGGYTEFSVDVTQAILPGKNLLAVRVDNRACVTKWPPVMGYFNYGGIHRDVTLEILDGPCLSNLRISALPTESADGILRFSGAVIQNQQKLTVEINCGGAKQSLQVNHNGTFQGELKVPTIEPWSPENPKLYAANISLFHEQTLLDQKTLDCGFRRVEIQKGRIFLNGQERKLKGICYVYDSPSSGLVMTNEQTRQDIALFKDLGVNTIRSHYPLPGHFYRACDQAGIMVWIEPPIYCYHPPKTETNTAFANPPHRKLAFQMAAEMILTARNHPCVIIYGIGNECNTEHPEAESFFRELCGSESPPFKSVRG
ncbi:MAG: glycoside hydrolase family 2 TIM barrel-domain containing protein [Verrucomicrobiae bacterium]|nr:glycoside hydrolase family 2 TIM barrel-domain containing protein [Verrucomicrobiae bacterium]